MSTAYYAGQGDIAFTQRVEVIIKTIEVVSLAAFIEGKLEPLHILGIATVGVTGEARVFLDDPLSILTWGHAAVVPWQGAVGGI